jgi:AraC family ethanolamine operon transcriptional activator
MSAKPDLTVWGRSFDDFDDFASAARDWDVDFRQLDRGPFRGELLQAISERRHVARARLGRGLLQQGSPPKGLRTFVVPAEPTIQFHWRGEDVSGDDLLAFPLGGELHAVSGPDFDVFLFSVSETLLAEAAELAGTPEAAESLARGEVFACDPRAMRALRKLFSRICHRLTRLGGQPPDPGLEHQLEFELPCQIVRALNNSGSSSCRATSQWRNRVVKEAEGYVRERAHEAPTVRDLCEGVGVSVRSLELAFREVYGLSPKAFVQAVRLNGVRKALREAHPSAVTVSDVANAWGFWHLGQFAADYRRHFGELPSQTLRFSPLSQRT